MDIPFFLYTTHMRPNVPPKFHIANIKRNGDMELF